MFNKDKEVTVIYENDEAKFGISLKITKEERKQKDVPLEIIILQKASSFAIDNLKIPSTVLDNYTAKVYK